MMQNTQQPQIMNQSQMRIQQQQSQQQQSQQQQSMNFQQQQIMQQQGKFQEGLKFLIFLVHQRKITCIKLIEFKYFYFFKKKI